MALGILILIFTATLQAEDKVNTADPNLYRKDGAMKYDEVDKLKDINSTAGALIIKEAPIKIPKTKTKKADPNPKGEPNAKDEAAKSDKDAVKPDDLKN